MTDINALANKVLARKHLGIDDAMQRVLGEYTEKNANLYSSVLDEIENILYPHGSGEDANRYDY